MKASRSQNLSLFAAASLLLLYFFWSKAVLYTQLEYTSDFFHFLQISRSWIEKGQLLMENAFGGHGPIHSYFLVLLAYPFTWAWGGLGLIAFLTLPYFMLNLELCFRLRLAFRRKLLLLALLYSPYAFFLFDNYVYGFHVELLYFPLSVLLGLALLQKSTAKIIFYTILLCLVREDGPVVASCVFLMLSFAAESSELRLWRRLFNRRSGGYHVLMLLCFGLHLLWLKHQASLHPEHLAVMDSRLSGALQHLGALFQQEAIRAQYWRMVKYIFAFPLIFILLLCPRLRAVKLFGYYLLATFFLFVINTVATAHAYPRIYETGLTWPPRAAAMFGIFLCLVTVKLLQRKSLAKWHTIFLLLSIWPTTIYLLKLDRNYSFSERFFAPFHREEFAARFVEKEHLEYYRKLAKLLPSRSPFVTDTRLFAIFDKHDLIWPDRENYSKAKAALYICDNALATREQSACLSAASKRPELKLMPTPHFTQIFGPASLQAFFE